MATATRSAKTALIWLGVLIALIGGSLATGVYANHKAWTPGLALDLAGGTEMILTAVPTDGGEITEDILNQSVEIIRRRVNATGVSEAEVTTSGGVNVIVSLPGKPDPATMDLVRKSAQLQFRPVIYAGGPTDTTIPALTDFDNGLADGTGSDYALVTDAVKAEFAALDCTTNEAYLGGDPGPSDAPFVSCDETTGRKLVLGPVELAGTDIANATPAAKRNRTGQVLAGQFEVALEFTSEGGKKFDKIANLLYDLTGDRHHFAMVLDGVVISWPTVETRTFLGRASISGGFTTVQEAEQLANQLKFGALPITLEPQSTQTIGATLGSSDLNGGLLAGAIGLILVVLYSTIQYRALGSVTVLSLVISAALTYGTITLLSWGIGYRLSLAGVAGLIVAIGITADSFIVYFERVRDELREGRSLVASVEHAWHRARRTILASDAVSLLAAVVLYSTAVGGVRGFAFTLGLTTVIDVVVVFLFTHPILVVLARTKFFGGGHRLSGLDPRQLGREAMYKGRGRVRESGLTLAEKKAALGGGKDLS